MNQEPQVVDDAAIAFGGDIDRLLPSYADIPDEFKLDRNPWNQLVSQWFHKGLRISQLQAVDGIDWSVAVRHLQAIMVSYEPKHERKIAGVAYLMSLWFKPPT